MCLKAYIAYGSNFHLWYMNELQPSKISKTSQLTIREVKLVGMFWERQQVSQIRIYFAISSILHIRALWGIDMQ